MHCCVAAQEHSILIDLKHSDRPGDLFHIQSWFQKNSLPWDTESELKLSTYGMLCVEHMYMYEPHEWDALFEAQPTIMGRIEKKSMKNDRGRWMKSKEVRHWSQILPSLHLIPIKQHPSG